MTNIGGPTYTLGSVADIPIKVHWSFGLLLLFVGYVAYNNGKPSEDVVWFFVYVGMLFLFVIMHEYGHALTARRYGIATRDIIISPIGGVARLEGLPSQPRHELLIAIAGPMVNVCLAILFLIILLVCQYDIMPQSDRINLIASPSDFISYLLLINGALVVFNMVPAFPMDGGRVLRAVLAMSIGDKLKATKIASIIGQLFAVAFIGLGLYFSHYVLVFVGLFVLVTARSEYRQMRLASRMSVSRLSDILSTQYVIIGSDQLMSSTFSLAPEVHVLVSDSEGQVIGSLPSMFIQDAKSSQDHSTPIGLRMNKSIGYLSEQMTVETAFHALNEYGWIISPVVDLRQQIVGVIDRQMIRDFIKG